MRWDRVREAAGYGLALGLVSLAASFALHGVLAAVGGRWDR